ncbi:hypothetical protein ACG94O_07720 [Acinetobacter ursingii]|uniref:hypothetical protein n=1 Tax=Acinetobacter ursingii TaxID=108980 RepID=UPI003AF737A6
MSIPVYAKNIYPNNYGLLTYDIEAPNLGISIRNAGIGLTGIENKEMGEIFHLFLTRFTQIHPEILIHGFSTGVTSFHFDAYFFTPQNYTFEGLDGSYQSDPVTITFKKAGVSTESDLYPSLGGSGWGDSAVARSCGLKTIVTLGT